MNPSRRNFLKTTAAAAIPFGIVFQAAPDADLKPKVEMPHVSVQQLSIGLLDVFGRELSVPGYGRAVCSTWRWQDDHLVNAQRISFPEATQTWPAVHGYALFKHDGRLVGQAAVANPRSPIAGDTICFMAEAVVINP